MKIAVKIKNPAKVAALFGAEAEDYRRSECVWWVGTPNDLFPAATADGAKVVNADVQFCGDGAWVRRNPRRTQPARRVFRAGYTDLLGSGKILAYAKAGHKADARRWIFGSRAFFETLP